MDYSTETNNSSVLYVGQLYQMILTFSPKAKIYIYPQKKMNVLHKSPTKSEHLMVKYSFITGFFLVLESMLEITATLIG